MKIMVTRFLFTFSLLFMIGCAPQNSELGEETIENMAMSDKVQTMFSEGRKQVVLQSEKTGQKILQNNLIEQESILNDPVLREEFLRLMMVTNTLLTQNNEGMERLMQQMIEVMQHIYKDKDKNIKLFESSLLSRKNAVAENDNVRTAVLTQNVNEEELRIYHPATSQKVKELSLALNTAIIEDPDVSQKMLQQNVLLFERIIENSTLRSRMADAMLIIMKEPKIQNEMKSMIAQALKMATETLKQEMAQEMKVNLTQMESKMKLLEQQIESINTNIVPEEKSNE